MKFVLLSSVFYDRNEDTPEMLEKEDRPYACLEVKVDGNTYAIPIRHNMNHPYGFHTIGNSGLDFSKSVVIESESDISDKAWISREEYNILIANEDRIFALFSRYLRQYKRALSKPDNPRSRKILRYSTLQYFDIN